MDYEQAYKQALERAKLAIKDCGNNKGRIAMIESIFSELKESEDARIRNAIHIYLDWLDGRKDYAPKGVYSIKSMIAWLEKQAGQKPAWSDEDEENLNRVIGIIERRKSASTMEPYKDILQTYINWLKSLKERLGGGYGKI